MANSLKSSAGGVALQVTKPARAAGLVEEDAEGDATHLAGVYVYGFDDLLLVVDAERIKSEERAELIATAASDSGSIHRGEAASVEIAGNGYQVQLPGCKAAGFEIGDDGHTLSADGVLLIHDGTQTRLADDLVTIRREQSHV
jgi:hypothetical protein